MGENRGENRSFLLFFAHFFTKKYIKQTIISMKVDIIAENINIEKLYVLS